MRDRFIALCGLLIVLGVAALAFGPRAAEAARLEYNSTCHTLDASCLEQSDAMGAMARARLAVVFGAFSLTLGLTVIPIALWDAVRARRRRPPIRVHHWLGPVAMFALILVGLLIALAAAGSAVDVSCAGHTVTTATRGITTVVCVEPSAEPLVLLPVLVSAGAGVISGLGVWTSRVVFA